AMVEVTESGAAPFLLDRDPMQAELAELRPEVTREGVAAVDLVGARRDLVGGETAHAVAQHVGGLAQAEVEAADVVYAHERQLFGVEAAAEGCGRALGLMHVLDLPSNIGAQRPFFQGSPCPRQSALSTPH